MALNVNSQPNFGVKAQDDKKSEGDSKISYLNALSVGSTIGVAADLYMNNSNRFLDKHLKTLDDLEKSHDSFQKELPKGKSGNESSKDVSEAITKVKTELEGLKTKSYGFMDKFFSYSKKNDASKAFQYLNNLRLDSPNGSAEQVAKINSKIENLVIEGEKLGSILEQSKGMCYASAAAFVGALAYNLFSGSKNS